MYRASTQEMFVLILGKSILVQILWDLKSEEKS